MGSTHVVEQLLFSIVPSILNFEFDSIFRLFFDYWGPMDYGLFLGLGQSSKTVLGTNHVVEQLLFSIVSSILTFDFDLIFGSFFTFWGTDGLFLGLG